MHSLSKSSNSIRTHTDEELAILSLSSQDCFLELIERYQDKLSRYLRRISNLRPEDTEDILQEIFIKVYQNLNGFDSALKFSSWIYRIAHNQAISYFRKHQSRGGDREVAWEDKFLNKVVTDIDLPREADLNILKEKLKIALSLLDYQSQEVIILRFWEQKDYQEISDIFKKPVGTISSMINRSKKKLKKELLKNNPYLEK